MTAKPENDEQALDWVISGLDFDRIIEAQVSAQDLFSVDMVVEKAKIKRNIRMDIGRRHAFRQSPIWLVSDWIASLDKSRVVRNCGMYRVNNSSFIRLIDTRNRASLLQRIGVHFVLISQSNLIDLVFHESNANRKFKYF